MISIIDYGMANLRSVQKAIEAVGHQANIIRTPTEVRDAQHLILPGVGAFKDAIRVLRDRGLDTAVLNHIQARKPFLGICLGFQLLFTTGHEDGQHPGLALFKGDVLPFNFDPALKLKVPHMGWNTLDKTSNTPLLNNLPPTPSVYFVHGFHVQTPDTSLIATTTTYGQPFPSSIHRENLLATQFHPEKSQATGLTMLKNFAEM